MKQVAIVFYGLTRSLKRTYLSIKTNIFDVLSRSGYTYTIYMHTYHIDGSYTNIRANEHCRNYDNTQHTILNPHYLLVENQDDCLKSLNIESYYTKLGNWTGMTPEITRYLIQNLVLALYSKKKIMEYLSNTGIQYDYIIIMRPDFRILTEIDISWFSELGTKSIIIPERDWFCGCNDRMCIATPDVALYYGNLYDQLLEYSKNKSIVSERFCLDMLNKQGLTIIKKPIEYTMVRADNN